MLRANQQFEEGREKLQTAEAVALQKADALQKQHQNEMNSLRAELEDDCSKLQQQIR